MKRVLTVAIVLLLCLSIALPVSAAIYNSPSTPVVEVEAAKMEGVDIALNDCIVVTTVKQAEEKSTDITDEERETLLKAYNGLVDGTDALPIEGEYAVREIVDVSFKNDGCRALEDHGNKTDILAAEDVTLVIDFNLGVAAGEKVVTFTYIDGKWNEIISTTNNGDGTVTCVFAALCPVAFAVVG